MKSKIFQRKRVDFCSPRSLILNIIYYRNEFLTRCKRSHGVSHQCRMPWEFMKCIYARCWVQMKLFSDCTMHTHGFWFLTNKRRKKMSIIVSAFVLHSTLHSHTWINNKWFCRHEILNSVHVPRSNTPASQFPLAMAFSIEYRNARVIIYYQPFLISTTKAFCECIGQSVYARTHNFRF